MESQRSQIESITRGQWQWNSNQDPLSKSEEPQWESYNPKENYLLERAYYEQQKEVDLGDSIVSIENMNQIQKTNLPSQRPVRRINFTENLEEVNRNQRYSDTELPKTINKIFGSLEDFIQFFFKRNLEILHFTQKFEEFESSNDVNGLNNEILPILLECLSQELKTDENAQDLLRLFKKVFISFKEFYGQILKAYTMNSGLYRNLNQYLRNESWIKIDSLLQYAFCLCKTFLSFKNNHSDINLKGNNKSIPTITLYRGTALDEIALSFYDLTKFPHFSWNSATSTTKSKRVAQNFMFANADIPNKKYPVIFIIEVPIEKNLQKDLRYIDVSSYSVFPKEDEILLAPGSAFELQEVNFDKNKIAKIFIKMKSETKSLAHRGFMMQGALQSEMLTDSIMKIMCLEDEELNEALGHIFGNKFIESIEFYFCKFNQKSLKKMMEVLATTEKVWKLKFLSCSNKAEEYFTSPKSKEVENSNIRKLEISEPGNFSTIFATNRAHSKYWTSLRELDINLRAMTEKTVNDICWQGLGLLSQLTHLSLNFHQCSLLSNEGVHNLCYNGLRFLTQLIYLYLDFNECTGITDEGVNSLSSQCLQHLTQLTSLTLRIGIWRYRDETISDKGIEILCLNGLKHLTELTYLEIDLPRDSEITDQGMTSFSSHGISHLTQLAHLKMTFYTFQKITDDGIKNFSSDGIKCLKNLKSLDLYLNDFPQLTDKAVKDLSCHGLKYLIKLKALRIIFSLGHQVTDQAFIDLFSYGLVYLTQLEDLRLTFQSMRGITDQGLNNLELRLITLPELKFLSLNGKICIDVLNQSIPVRYPQQEPKTHSQSLIICTRTIRVQNDYSQIPFWKFQLFSQVSRQSWSTSNMPQKEKANFKKLKRSIACNKSFLQEMKFKFGKLRFLAVQLSQFESKTREELHYLIFQAREYLTKLESLHIDFCKYSHKAVENFKALCSEGFQYLRGLIDLQLRLSQDFWHSEHITNVLCNYNLRHLTHLRSLHLNFSNSYELSDEDVNNLCLHGLKNLAQLTYLNLNFRECSNIRGEGINTLLDKGLENLTQLKSLSINFSLSHQNLAKFEGIINCRGFQNLTQLTSLSLDFSRRWLMTESVMENLCSQGIQNLTKLEFLEMNFNECFIVRDREVVILCSKGFKYLTQLRHLALDFSRCRVLTDQGVDHLCFEILKHLTQLEYFKLNFWGCDRITPDTKQNMQKVLRLFGFRVSVHG